MSWPRSAASIRGRAASGISADVKWRFMSLMLIGAILLFAVPATSAKKPHRRCVLPRGKTLVSNRLIKVVRVDNADFQVLSLYGCAYKRNKVRHLADENNGSDMPSSLVVRRNAGTWIIYEGRFVNQLGSAGTTAAVDIASGHRFTIQRYSTGGMQGSNPPPQLSPYFLTRDGRVVAAFTDLTVTGSPPMSQPIQVRIVAFSSRGVSRQLDMGPPPSLPAGSLTLKGSVASWIHDGQTRSAQL